MKIASLLAEYLYSQKRLDLPGIGSFLLSPPVQPDADNSKQGRAALAEGISFEHNTGIKETPGLIDYIATSTGKIKALAAADLDSHLELARQFLNIGKPFQFEGIGSLTKTQGGTFSFVSGAIVPEKIKETVAKEISETETSEDTGGGFKSIFYGRKVTTSKRKTLAILLLLAGLGLALWGGYTIYKKTVSKNRTKEKAEAQNKPADETPVTKKDSLTVQPVSTMSTAGQYKFVVEAADKLRGLTRYNKLKGFGLPIEMRTSDSVRFELFFTIPASPADTSRLLDSLQRLYTPPGGKAYVSM